MTPATRSALRALRDCGVIRAEVYHPGLAGLVVAGLAGARPFPQHEDESVPKRDFRLNPAGWRAILDLDAQGWH